MYIKIFGFTIVNLSFFQVKANKSEMALLLFMWCYLDLVS